VTSTRASNLLQHAAVHDRDPVAHRHRLDRDVDRRRPQAPLKLEGLDAQLRIQVRERLVHQEDRRLAHDCPPRATR